MATDVVEAIAATVPGTAPDRVFLCQYQVFESVLVRNRNLSAGKIVAGAGLRQSKRHVSALTGLLRVREEAFASYVDKPEALASWPCSSSVSVMVAGASQVAAAGWRLRGKRYTRESWENLAIGREFSIVVRNQRLAEVRFVAIASLKAPRCASCSDCPGSCGEPACGDNGRSKGRYGVRACRWISWVGRWPRRWWSASSCSWSWRADGVRSRNRCRRRSRHRRWRRRGSMTSRPHMPS